MLAFPDPPPRLTDETVALRLAAERDIPEVLIAHQDDPRLAAALGLHRPPSGAELGRRAEQSAAARATGRELWLTVVSARAGDDECRGQIDVHDVDIDNRRASLTIWITPADRGRGLGSAALALAGGWLLHDAGLERVQVLAEPTDRLAGAPPGWGIARAALRAGFRSEGVLRGYAPGPTGRRDVEVLSLVRADVGG